VTKTTGQVGIIIALAAGTLLAGGCGGTRAKPDPQRYRRGLVIVLPGIEGESIWNRRLARGLEEGGVTSAIEVTDWTLRLGFVVNLTSLERNKRQAAQLAARIVEYRERYPGNIVQLVGHSGGAGIAVLTLEALPPGRQLDCAILLAPALSPGYDLSTALRRTRFGIWSFYSKKDAALLKVATSLLGPIDRNYGPAAGAVGFAVPPELGDSDRQVYEQRLHQVAWTPRLAEYGADGSHLGWTTRRFARDYLAPVLVQHEAARPLPIDPPDALVGRGD